MRGKRGISPVIATVILVAVAITVAVSVAFWMGGISGQYTRFEKLQVQDPVIVKYYNMTDNAGANNHWNLTFTVKNVGSTDATIEG
ncbi:type IV pilin, partial [Candidatus Bathyarchaeota archaeon]|nr:type IV pilin [Candidatus Bathyarchaeota archaeon]